MSLTASISPQRLAGHFLLERQQRSTISSIVQLLLDTVRTSEANLGPGRYSKLRLALDPSAHGMPGGGAVRVGGGVGGGGGAGAVSGRGGIHHQGLAASGRVEHIRQTLMNSIFDSSAGTGEDGAARTQRRPRRNPLNEGLNGSSSSSSASSTSSLDGEDGEEGGGPGGSEASGAVSVRTGRTSVMVVGEEADDRLTRRCVEKALQISDMMKTSFKQVRRAPYYRPFALEIRFL